MQFFEHLQQASEARSAYLPNSPIYLGLALIGCGIVVLVVSLLQYRWTVGYLWSGSFAQIAGMASEPGNSPVMAVGVMLIFIGLFAFFAVLLRLS